MPTIITHAVIGASCAKLFPQKTSPWRIYLAAIFCSVLADADVAAFSLGIDYGHFLGHRGFSHSLFFALVLSLAVVFCFFRKVKLFSGRWLALVYLFFIVGASHGVLDALTDGGMGIALLSPFDNSRYFFPWRPLPVSPIGLSNWLSRPRLSVLFYEMKYIWLPISMVLVTVHFVGYIFKNKFYEPEET